MMKTEEWSDWDAEASILTAVAGQEDVGKRLDAFAAEATSLTRSAVAKLIEEGNVLLDGNRTNKNARLKLGTTVTVHLPPLQTAEALPENIPLDIVYEDADIVVVNKPVGMVVHPAAGNPTGTLVNALLYHCGSSLSGIGGVLRPGIVHRIDKDTSGLLVVAKNDESHLFLSEQLKGHHIDRIYTAIAIGNFREESGTVDAPIGRHPIDRKKMAVIRNPDLASRDAVTHWTVRARGEADGNAFTLLRCQLETGRTHQIRVHLASIGHPLLGDEVYGGDNTRFGARHASLLQGQCLHAGEIRFLHPRTKEPLTFYAPMPHSLGRVTEILFGNIEI